MTNRENHLSHLDLSLYLRRNEAKRKAKQTKHTTKAQPLVQQLKIQKKIMEPGDTLVSARLGTL